MSDSDDSDFQVQSSSRKHKRKSKHNSDDDDEEEEEEEEEEDSDDDEEFAQSKSKRSKKKKKFSVHNFLDEEAEVDDDEDEDYDDEDELEHEHGGHIVEGDDFMESGTGSAARLLDSKMRMKEFINQNPEDIERYYAERYRDQTYTDRFGEGEAMAESIVQQSLLPGIKDPNLWVIRCRIGEEKTTVLTLMRKFFSMQTTNNPLQIKSVFTKEGLKGYIYVEAFRQNHVKDAIDGINALALSKYQQTLVPIGEMTDVLKVVKETGKLKSGQWVRIKSGLYRDDLALVDYVEDAQNTAHLKLVPRIDYDRFKTPSLRSTMEPAELDAQKPRRFKRPPPMLLDRSKVKDRIQNEGSYAIVNGSRYDVDGFLRKDFRLNTIVSGGIRPTLSELERFGQTSDGSQLALVASMVNKNGPSVQTAAPNAGKKAQNAAGSLIVTHAFTPGDIVEVSEGDLQNLRGRVLSVEGDSRIVVQPNHSDLKDPIPFSPAELTKYFSQGDHVKVLAGPFEGETGLVIRFEPTLAIVLSDTSMNEMKVMPKNLRLWQDHATNVTASNSQVQLFDLVKVDPQTVGVIVGVERDRVSVLTVHNKLVSLKANTALKRHNLNAQRVGKSLDKNGNMIQTKDSVTFTDKPYLGMTGEVKHIYRHWAFVYCRTYSENSSIIVVKSRQLTLVGAPTVQAQIQPTNRNASTGGGDGNPRGGSWHAEKKLAGKTARIVAGTLKGLTGIICDATQREVLLELHSQYRKVHVLRENIAILDSAGRIVSTGTSYGGTTHTPRNTSVHVSQTPMHGSQTPHASSMTPRPDATPLSNYFLPSMATPALRSQGNDEPMTPNAGFSSWHTPNDYNRLGDELSDDE